MNRDQLWLRLTFGLILLGTAMVTACGTDALAPGSDPEQSIATATEQPTGVTRRPQPTPDDSGLYRGLTLDEAQALTNFPIVMPEPVSPSLQFVDILVKARPATEGTWQPADTAILTFRPADDPDAVPIELWQTAHYAEVAVGPQATRTRTTIKGEQVTKVVQPNLAGTPITTYTWERQGVSFQLLASSASGVSDETPQQLVAAVPEQR